MNTSRNQDIPTDSANLAENKGSIPRSRDLLDIREILERAAGENFDILDYSLWNSYNAKNPPGGENPTPRERSPPPPLGRLRRGGVDQLDILMLPDQTGDLHAVSAREKSRFQRLRTDSTFERSANPTE